MQLMADPQMTGQLVKCPGCNTKLQVPPGLDADSENPGALRSGGASGKGPARNVWKEQDPTNPNALLSVGIGMGITLVWFAIIYFFQAPPGKSPGEFTTGEMLANLFYKHFTVSFANTLFFCWAAAICYLKMLKLKHQRRAMLLDVLPMDLGEQINAKNVGSFIDHVYSLPETLRDSLMVNRIRKALEFFEGRQNVADVSTLMASQSGIDGSRIMGSYILIRAFLWAIPLLGFIGTVVGLSHAISGMSFSNVEDVSKIVGSINNVTSGLGTAFDATLLGLVFAVLLNFPLNSLAKHEEEALNDIDAFCNEVLLPRLDDGSVTEDGESTQNKISNELGAVAEAIVRAITSSQKEFLTDLNTLSGRMLDYATTLEGRNEQYQQAALQHLAEQAHAVDSRAQEHFELMRQRQEEVMNRFSSNFESLEKTSREAFETLVHSQNKTVGDLTQKLGSLSTGMEAALSASLAGTQKAVSGLGENIAKLEANSKEYQEALRVAQQDAVKLFGQRADTISTSVAEQLTKAVGNVQSASSSAIESMVKSQTTVVSELVQKLGALSTGVESAVNASLTGTQRAITGMGENIVKLESNSKEFQEGLRTAQQDAVKLFGQRVDTISTSIAEQLTKAVGNVQSASSSAIESMVKNQTNMVSELVQKLGSLSSGVESAVNASLTGTQRAITGMGENIVKLESNSKEFQEALRTVQQDAVKMFAQRVDSAASGIGDQLTKAVGNIQTSTSGAMASMLKSQTDAVSDLVQKLGTMSSGVERALASSVEGSTRAIAGFGEHLSKMERTSKDYQQAVQSAQQEASKLFADKIGVMAAGVGESLQTSVQMTQRTISGIEAGIGNLNAVLERLGGQQIVIQHQQPQPPQQSQPLQQPQPQKKGWFGRG